MLITEERTNCLATIFQPVVCYAVCENQRSELRLNDVTNALATGGGKPGQGYPAVVYSFEPGIAARDGSEGRFVENVSPTIRANMGDNRTSVVYAIDQQGGKGMAGYAQDVCPTICSDSHGTPHAVAYGLDGYNQTAEEEVAQALRAAEGGDSTPKVIIDKVYGYDGRGGTINEQMSNCVVASAWKKGDNCPKVVIDHGEQVLLSGLDKQQLNEVE